MKIRSTKRSLGGMAVAAAFATVLVNLAGTGTASAAGAPDLVVAQAASDGTASGHTKVTVTVRNAGDSAASNIIYTTQVSGSSLVGAALKSSTLTTVCPAQGFPAHHVFQFSCYISVSLAAGATYTAVIDYSGSAGKAFTNVLSAGGSPSDANYANNVATLSTYFGPAADLKASQQLLRAGARGSRSIRGVITNDGPWTAKSIQLILEIKAPSFHSITATSSVPGAACQLIPPAAGYHAAASCVLSSLAPRKTWTLNFLLKGAAGSTLLQKAVVSSLVVDPVTSNNTATTRTTFTS